MKPSLQLKFSQQLTMTPQLQQAIKLLQLSTLDLQQEIQEALESNPLLEMADFSQEIIDKSAEVSKQANSTEQSAEASAGTDAVDTHDALENSDLPKDLPVDSSWEEYLGSSSAPVKMIGTNPDDDYVYQGETTDSIRDHLLWQVEMSPFSDTDKSIAMAIIDSIDDSGYLTVSCDDILESVDNENIELDEVECVLKRIQ
ncbi:MAG: RNA polymerase factor sigma-54, partial [Pseudomonadota bacterium]